MINESQKSSTYRRAVRLIEMQRKILAESDAPSDLLDAYSRIVRHLNKQSVREIQKLMGIDRPPVDTDGTTISPDILQRMTKAEVERLIASPDTPRKQLENVAVYRFGVPKGSMRSFSNVARLRDKLQTLVDNERSHDIIGSIAGRSSSHPAE